MKAVCARHNVSEVTYYTWKRKYGGLEVDEAWRLRTLEEAYPSKSPRRIGHSLGHVILNTQGYDLR